MEENKSEKRKVVTGEHTELITNVKSFFNFIEGVSGDAIRAEMYKLPDGRFMSVYKNAEIPDSPETAYIITEMDAISEYVTYSFENDKAKLRELFSEKAVDAFLNGHEYLLKDAQHVLTYTEGDLEESYQVNLYKTPDAKFIRVLNFQNNEEKHQIISEESAIEEMVLSKNGIKDSHLRNIFSEDTVDQFTVMATDKPEAVSPESLLETLRGLKAGEPFFSELKSAYGSMEALHTASNGFQLYDIMSTENPGKNETAYLLITGDDELAGKFVQVKQIKDSMVIRVLDAEAAIKSIEGIDAGTKILTMDQEEVLFPEGRKHLVEQVKWLVENPPGLTSDNSISFKPWPHKIEDLTQEGYVLVKIDKDNSQAVVYNWSNSFWKMDVNGKQAFQISEEQAINHYMDYPIRGLMITDQVLFSHFSQFAINNYKADAGWDHELPIEKINAYLMLADKAVMTMAGNVQIKSPEGGDQVLQQTFKDRVTHAIETFTDMIAKDFSKGNQASSLDFAKHLSEYELQATCKNSNDAFYSKSGHDGRQHLYVKDSGAITLLSSISTTPNIPYSPAQHLTMTQEQVHGQTL